MNNKNLIQKVSNQIMTWSNNTLFSEEHSVASKVAKEEKKYDHILFIPKKKETGIPITSSAEGVQRLDWYSNQLSDHWLIYTELNIGGEKLTVGSFNIQNLLGLDKSLYTLQDLVDYFTRASQMNIDIIGIQELGKSHKIDGNQREGIDIISDILKQSNSDT